MNEPIDIKKLKSELLARATAKIRARQIEQSLVIIPTTLFIVTEEHGEHSIGIQGITPSRADAWARIKNLENNPDARYGLLEHNKSTWVKTYCTQLSKVESTILAAH